MKTLLGLAFLLGCADPLAPYWETVTMLDCHWHGTRMHCEESQCERAYIDGRYVYRACR